MIECFRGILQSLPTSVHLLPWVSGLEVLVDLGHVLHHALPVWTIRVHHLTEFLHGIQRQLRKEQRVLSRKTRTP